MSGSRRARIVVHYQEGPDSRIRTDLGDFTSIRERPLASASIAQVHEAELLDGTPVVVKVQRPGIRRKVTADLRVLAWVAPRLVGKIPIAALSNPPALVELFAETICEELDFKLEVANLFEVDRALRANPRHNWEVPSPVLDLVTERVIVMSRVGGIPLGEVQHPSADREQVAAVFRQMVEGLLEGAVIQAFSTETFMLGMCSLDSREASASSILEYWST
ncbi:MAG: hypothetical protein CM1200mP26_02750 [Acidimicrobiales bacterium]|nr:MAG: hypothetical protein CM1200mP26_02750 [Acidimicrobiales bacterium]